MPNSHSRIDSGVSTHVVSVLTLVAPPDYHNERGHDKPNAQDHQVPQVDANTVLCLDPEPLVLESCSRNLPVKTLLGLHQVVETAN
jgi:hypothetical protein